MELPAFPYFMLVVLLAYMVILTTQIPENNLAFICSCEVCCGQIISFSFC